jgi:hypothetical protein
MDILKKVDEFKKKGIIIEVNAIDQIENGMKEQTKKAGFYSCLKS